MTDALSERAPLHWQGLARDAAPADAGLLAHVRHTVGDDARDCPLVWLDGDFAAERWSIDGPIERGTAHGWQYARQARLAFACIHLAGAADPRDPAAVEHAAYDAYRRLFALQRTLGLAHVQRIWHWLSDVTAGNGDDERYRRLCVGRAQALDADDCPLTVLPPATLVAGHAPGLRLHALLGDTPVVPIENPRQISAYRYPRDYGKRAPAFARAGVAQLAASRYLLISGTASIVGHETRHTGDLAAQTDEALNNVDAVIDAAAPAIGHRVQAGQLQAIKGYLRDPADAAAVARHVRARLPGVPLALLHAPLCRPDLLVEFEAQMPLDQNA